MYSIKILATVANSWLLRFRRESQRGFRVTISSEGKNAFTHTPWLVAFMKNITDTFRVRKRT